MCQAWQKCSDEDGRRGGDVVRQLKTARGRSGQRARGFESGQPCWQIIARRTCLARGKGKAEQHA